MKRSNDLALKEGKTRAFVPKGTGPTTGEMDD